MIKHTKYAKYRTTDQKLAELYTQRDIVNQQIKSRRNELERIRLRKLARGWLTKDQLVAFMQATYAGSEELARTPTRDVHAGVNAQYGLKASGKRIAGLMREMGFERRSTRVGTQVINSYVRSKKKI